MPFKIKATWAGQSVRDQPGLLPRATLVQFETRAAAQSMIDTTLADGPWWAFTVEEIPKPLVSEETLREIREVSEAQHEASLGVPAPGVTARLRILLAYDIYGVGFDQLTQSEQTVIILAIDRGWTR